jgi:lipopolysaccharide transport system permease protein
MKLSSEIIMKLPTMVIQPRKGFLHLGLRVIWQHRELLFFLAWRDLKIRYKQTMIGVGWAVLQPLMTMLVFTVIFGKFAKIPSDGIPYPIFAYAALLPWTYFSQSLNRSTTSLVGNSQLITKIYFPRLIMPLAGVMVPTVDFALSFLVMIGLMSWYHITPTWGLLALPLFLMLASITALAVGLWLSPLNVKYRDINHVVPFLTQLWMYASPIVYPVSLVPEKWRLLYSLNPMAGVIEGVRWGLLGKQSPPFTTLAVSATMIILFFLGGMVFFKHMERTFADVI